ncbi:hypothetical protein ANI_1_1336084 [Paecilomyces variotii No. 5]|uniref:Acyl-CoA dehydrogenase n=1 Tax=Byssochlamys spectabilis (strain No. 5 / NBRC 109023) TaxID=1356009 RepID=V5I0C4_BYSSN|nr:hypothetical protein ANI_1_1336084 [Paecilomyces variotii No. 5]
MKPSSSTDGFFQPLPIVHPAYTFEANSSAERSSYTSSDDAVLARILELYLPRNSHEARTSVHRLARRALDPAILRLATDAELHTPTLRPLTTFGEENRVDPLWTGEGWRTLKAIGQEEGLVTVGYEENNSACNRRIHQFALNHVWASSAAMTGCPASMTDGAAKLLAAHLKDDDGDQPGRGTILRESYRRLISRDPIIAWTAGQWMTERTGGSDVRGTETIARRLTPEELTKAAQLGKDRDAHGLPLGPWQIDGFKWFSSATDSDMALLLAQTGKGLSLFYVPLRRRIGAQTDGTELNGIRIQRLKNKIGTKSLPTAELELKGVRGWLIGEEGRGVKEIATILNMTRLYTASSSAAGWGRALAICRGFTKARKTQGVLLQDNPQHVRWMAGETVRYWAATHFTFFGIALQGAIEQSWDSVARNTKAADLIPRDRTKAMLLLRLILPATKARVSVSAVESLRNCMECLGGVGYCENNEDGGLLNIAKIFRDTLVNPIWEGTVSVMAEDVVRVITDKRLDGGQVLERVLGSWVKDILNICKHRFSNECGIVEKRLQILLATISGRDRSELLWRGRELLDHLEAIVCSCLLMYDACTDSDETAAAVASRWVSSKDFSPYQVSQSLGWKQESVMDKKIFLGADSGPQSKL